MTEGIPEVVTPALVLGPSPEGHFKAVASPPKWAFAKVAVAAKSKDDMKQLAALVQLTLALVVAEERDRLDDYLSENDEAMDKLQDAIAELTSFWSGRPLAQPSSSSASSETESQAPLSRVVSFSRGTVETVETPEAGPSESAAG